MARPQHGIFSEGTSAHHHLELQVRSDAPLDGIVAALAATRVAGTAVRTNGGVALVVGFGPDLWGRLGDQGVDGRAFGGYRSPDGRHEAPATQRDVWIWLHGPSPDVVLDVLRPVVAAWRDVAEVVLDLTGFTYHDSRDLTGFIDGTANPNLDEAPAIASVPAGTPGEGGCFAMTMQFRHDLDAFDALPVADQEAVFGRAKVDSTELEGDAKPATAHISRVEVDDDQGEELKVYRRSVPWATGTAQGLHFVSFGADVDRFDVQLRHQYGMVDDGVTDRLLDFTTALTGSFWYCPPVEELDRLAPLPDDD